MLWSRCFCHRQPLPQPQAPTMITTNLKLSELKSAHIYARIYYRILEKWCALILFDGNNFRIERAGATRQTAKDIVNSKQDWFFYRAAQTRSEKGAP